MAIAWSISKVDCASECLRKYKRTYIDKVPQDSHALTLGKKLHDIQADELKCLNVDHNKLLERMDLDNEMPAEAYTMAPNVLEFTKKWTALCNEHKVTGVIEQKYGVTKDLRTSSFFDPNVYLRGVIDLWCYVPSQKRFMILDHKSSKQKPSQKQVAENRQLNVYAWLLMTLYPEMQWKRAEVALHHFRSGAIVWADLRRDDVRDYGQSFLHLLTLLEETIEEAEIMDNWPMKSGFHCNWCSFNKECFPEGRPKKNKEESPNEVDS